MRVVAWNLGGAYGSYIERHEQAWEWLAGLKPDVALLQECVPPAWARGRWTILVLPFDHWGSAIVARPELGLEAVPLAEGSLLDRFGSYLATGELTLPDGGSLLIGSVHARAAEAPDWVTAGHDRARMARPSVGVPWPNDVIFTGYAELVAGRRFLVGGDWNTARYLDENGHPSEAGSQFFDRAQEAGWIELSLDADGQEGQTWYGSASPRPYQPDHVFAARDTTVARRGMDVDPYPVEGLNLSDHAPIVIDLEVSEAVK